MCAANAPTLEVEIVPDLPEEAVQAAAEVLYREYDSEFGADHLSWRDFTSTARAALEAAECARHQDVCLRCTETSQAAWKAGREVERAERFAASLLDGISAVKYAIARAAEA